MKQQTTKEQWSELSDDNKRIFAVDITMESGVYRPNIGQMIEFLGDYLVELDIEFGLLTMKDDEYLGQDIDFPNGELCDALWEAVKHKLIKEY